MTGRERSEPILFIEVNIADSRSYGSVDAVYAVPDFFELALELFKRLLALVKSAFFAAEDLSERLVVGFNLGECFGPLQGDDLDILVGQLFLCGRFD